MKTSLRKRPSTQKSGHIPISVVALSRIFPSPENEQLYRTINANDPDIVQLAESITKIGLQEPLVITEDGYVVSGHRRRIAAYRAGLRKVPVRRLPFSREGNPEFIHLLREYNRQRVKTVSEQIHEEVLSVDPDQAYLDLTRYRARKAAISAESIEIRESRRRAVISAAKLPFLEACKAIIVELRPYWPLGARQIHYQLLNNPPLVHAGKGRRYRNDRSSYKALVDLLTRARHAGRVSHEVIADATRPFTEWRVWPTVGQYFRQELSEVLNDYSRDLLQSQSNHLEVVAEKLTVEGILRPVASRYCLPMTIGRGFCSTRPLFDIAKRFKKSGKTSLVILSISDLDPDGEEITHSIARRLRDDFRLPQVKAVKVALTRQQVARLELPANAERAKRTSANYDRYMEVNGDDRVYELEAVPPRLLQELLSEAICDVIDVELFNAEVELEKDDAAHISTARRQILGVLKGFQFEGSGAPP